MGVGSDTRCVTLWKPVL